ncbi:MAG: 3'-5' exonuclease [Bacteroidota bacterium]
MEFQLDRDIVFFDLEATGLNVLRDRIVQLAAVKYFADGRASEEISMLINPGIPISIEAMQVHGILPRDVANKPTFRQVADEIFAFFNGADLGGYNSNRFDIPMLIEEFARVGMEFDMNNRRLIDVQRIFYKMEPRTLKAAVKFYCGEDMQNAHDALADVQATVQVLKGQLERYKDTNYEDNDGNEIIRPIKNDMAAIHDFCNDLKFVDATQKLRYDENDDVVFNFGKYNNQLAGKVLYEDQQYYNWILNKEFSAQVKQAVKELVKEYKRNL